MLATHSFTNLRSLQQDAMCDMDEPGYDMKFAECRLHEENVN